jgi:hypothetical protein
MEAGELQLNVIKKARICTGSFLLVSGKCFCGTVPSRGFYVHIHLPVQPGRFSPSLYYKTIWPMGKKTSLLLIRYRVGFLFLPQQL